VECGTGKIHDGGVRTENRHGKECFNNLRVRARSGNCRSGDHSRARRYGLRRCDDEALVPATALNELSAVFSKSEDNRLIDGVVSRLHDR
jgi:hypothetical protein